MVRKAPEQLGLEGVPQPKKRKVIQEIEDLCLEIDEMCGKRTAISDEIAEKVAERQAMIKAKKLDLYTYQDASGVLQDVFIEEQTKKKKSKLNPKKKKTTTEES